MAEHRAAAGGGSMLLRIVAAIVITFTLVAIYQAWAFGLGSDMLFSATDGPLGDVSKLEVNGVKGPKAILAAMASQAQELHEQKGLIEQLDAVVKNKSAQIEDKDAHIAELKNEVAMMKERVGELRFGVLNRPHAQSWKQRTFTHHGPFGLVKYSTYRLERDRFATMALANLRHQNDRDLKSCLWIGRHGNNIQGQLSIMYHEEHHDMMYEVVVIFCTLEKATMEDGGFLIANIDREEILLFNEEAMESLEPQLTSKLSVCGSPLFGKLEPQAVWEWMEYNRVALGVDKFFFYDVHCLDEPVMTRLKNYTEAGMLDITTITMPYDAWYMAQGLFMHDCMYRNRLTSQWIMFHDLDEYPYVIPPNTMDSILKQHAEKPWITHQATWYGMFKCNKKNESGLWDVERAVFRWPYDFCHNQKKLFKDTAFCLSDKGHRKFIVNPRKSFLLAIHYVKEPADGGADLHVNKEMTHNHYQGLNKRGQVYEKRRLCSEKHGEDDKVDWWWRDERFARLVATIRQCSFGNHTCEHQLT